MKGKNSSDGFLFRNFLLAIEIESGTFSITCKKKLSKVIFPSGIKFAKFFKNFLTNKKLKFCTFFNLREGIKSS